MWQRFTERARRVILLGQEEAIKRNSEQVSTAHLLLGLARQEKSTGAQILQQMGVAPADAWAATSAKIPADAEVASGEPLLTSSAKRVLKFAADEAQFLQHEYVGTEHLLLALLREADAVAALILNELGVSLSETRAQLTEFLSANPDLAQRTTQISQSSIDYAPEIFELLATAKQETRDAGDWQLETVHLLRALCHPDREGSQILREAGVNIEALRAWLQK